MISKRNFKKLFSLYNNPLNRYEFSEPNEENIFEFQFYNSNNDCIFYTYDNRLYYNCNFDFDQPFKGEVIAVDGETKEIEIIYEDSKTMIKDIITLLTFNN